MNPPDRHQQTPNYRRVVLKPKSHDHALVIPVVNEGNRIRRQLARIAAKRPAADIVIADGGSTDGSMDLEFLKSTGVRALLTKHGPSDFSAQLRMSYAWCLAEDYLGVVSMDGNDKDDVDAIDAFIAKLKDGYAYVQGSRYRPGGRSINLPLDRHLAGRLIHAPLLSLAGRRKYTDTTNGFRAYSSEYLRDARVAPFRDMFRRYSLQYYLTARAGQLGYNTCEIPVTRAYPASSPTPSKIVGLKGRAAIIRDLFAVAFGRYDPET